MNLVAASLLAPLSEEFAKGLGVRFMMRRATTRAQALTLGADAGAGFGFLEALLYGLAGISEDLGGWWQIMLIRAGSTSTHVFDTALVGLAWWYWSIGRRHGVAAGLAAIAVLEHAAWNGFATVLDSRVFGLEDVSEDTLRMLVYGMVAVVSPLLVLATLVMARRLRDTTPPVLGTPLEGMRPWLG